MPEVKGKYIEKDGEFTRANNNFGSSDISSDYECANAPGAVDKKKV